MKEPSPERLKDFYEKEYERGTGITPIPDDNDFMYGQFLANLKPYLKPGITALDLGCNNGNLSFYMARAGCDVLGIDIAQNVIDLAKKSGLHYRLCNARFECIDFINDWHTEGVFDLVLCVYVIEHVPEDRLFLQRISQTLKPGGFLVLTVPLINSSLYRLSKWVTGLSKVDEEVGHLHRYTYSGIVSMAREAGFMIDRTVFLDGPFRDWFIRWRPLRAFNVIWHRPVIRVLLNMLDSIMAQHLFPAGLCLHARRN